jgi:molybdate/tungstate transport system ATP-binding protein
MIEVKNLSLQIGEFSLRNLNFSINDREYFVVLGPSGAGKTVLLECMAGLHRIKKGEIWIDGTDVTHLSPEERKIGYVPQDYVLFPFLSVAQNIEFGLKRGKYDRLRSRKRMTALADLLGISHLLDRDTRSLSGGEKQRVALARALAPSPMILLMDEPLSALDMQTSNYLRLELRRIHQELGVTTVHITHNHLEAEELADRIAIMSSGEIVQVGQPDDIFFDPQNEAVVSFTGSLNILECSSCRRLVPGLVEVDCNGMRVVLPHDEGDLQKIAISPRDIYISDALPPGSSVNRYQGSINTIEVNATTAKLSIKVDKLTLKVEMPAELSREMNLVIGKEVYLILKLRRLKVLRNKENGKSDQYSWYYQEII